MKRFTVLVSLGFLLFALHARADVPDLVNFQGLLLDASGQAVPDGNYAVKLQVYAVASGPDSPLWADNFNVTTTAGRFTLVLGSVTALPANLFAEPNRWVGITVGGDPELTPRTQLTSVPYSTRVGTIDGATGGTISGDVSIQSDLAVDGLVNARRALLADLGPTQVPLTVQASAAQTAPLVELKNSLGAVLMNVGPEGNMEWVLPLVDDAKPTLLFRGASGQTDPYVEVENHLGQQVFTVGAEGGLDFMPQSDDGKPALSLFSSLTQSDNHVEIKNSVGGALLTIDANGALAWRERPDDGKPDILLRGVVFQFDPLLEVRTESDEPLLRISSSGGLNFLPQPDDGRTALSILATPGQADNHLEIQEDNGAGTGLLLAWFDPSGALHIRENSDTDPVADNWTTYSSAAYKQDIRELSKAEYAEALDKLVATPVVRYRYKGQSEFDKEKTGIIIEEAPAEVVAEGNPRAASLSEYISLLHAALKAQQSQIESLESRLVAVEAR